MQACPTFLHRGFMDLFPEKNLKPNHLTIINISQFTENDMSSWSMEVEDEREAFMQNVSGNNDVTHISLKIIEKLKKKQLLL